MLRNGTKTGIQFILFNVLMICILNVVWAYEIYNVGYNKLVNKEFVHEKAGEAFNKKKDK